MIFNPHAYQQYAINKIISTPRLALWLDMGLGKTAITLTAVLDLLFNRFAVWKVLIIAPLKVAENTWQAEIEKWDHTKDLKYSTVLGSQKKRIQALNTPASIYIINRDNVAWLQGYYKNHWPFDMVVIDEASSFKNYNTKRFKALKSVRKYISRLVELTGTPSPKGMIDLWAQMYLLDGGYRLGDSVGKYRDRWFIPDKRNRERIFSYKIRDKNAENEILGVLSDICISMKAEDYIELPEIIDIVSPILLDEKAKEAYDTIEKTMLLTIDETTIEAMTASSLYGKLLQLCNGALYDEDRNVFEIHDCKLEALREHVEALNGEHAIIYYSFQHDIDRIKKALSPLNLNVVMYKGRQQEHDWNAGKIDILLAHPASASYGLNLQQGGHHCIWYGVNSSLELTLQANKRLHRQGQQYPVIIHRLIIAGSIEEEVLKNLKNKDDEENAVLNAVRARIEHLKQAE